MEIRNEMYEDQGVLFLGGCDYVDCLFINCIISLKEYSSLRGCTLKNCVVITDNHIIIKYSNLYDTKIHPSMCNLDHENHVL